MRQIWPNSLRFGKSMGRFGQIRALSGDRRVNCKLIEFPADPGGQCHRNRLGWRRRRNPSTSIPWLRNSPSLPASASQGPSAQSCPPPGVAGCPEQQLSILRDHGRDGDLRDVISWGGVFRPSTR